MINLILEVEELADNNIELQEEINEFANDLSNEVILENNIDFAYADDTNNFDNEIVNDTEEILSEELSTEATAEMISEELSTETTAEIISEELSTETTAEMISEELSTEEAEETLSEELFTEVTIV